MIYSAKKQILCVDNSKDDCELFNFILTQAGYEVEIAQSLTEALQLLENNQFDLYLFDISLSDGTGFELLKQVRAIDLSIPIIICSADARESTRQQVIQAGAQAFLTKPINFDLLIETIAQFINSTEST